MHAECLNPEELIKHNVFIEPPINERDGNVSIEAHFYALSYTDINDLKEEKLMVGPIESIKANCKENYQVV